MIFHRFPSYSVKRMRGIPPTGFCTIGAQGFTLLEIIIVMAVVALLLGTVVPRIGAGWKRMEQREFLQEFVHTISQTRLLAMNTGRDATFRIRGGSQRVYGIDSPPSKPIPPNVDVYSDELGTDPKTGDSTLTFYPDGTPSGGTIEVVFDQHTSYGISVHPLTGNVRWEVIERRGKKP